MVVVVVAAPSGLVLRFDSQVGELSGSWDGGEPERGRSDVEGASWAIEDVMDGLRVAFAGTAEVALGRVDPVPVVSEEPAVARPELSEVTSYRSGEVAFGLVDGRGSGAEHWVWDVLSGSLANNCLVDGSQTSFIFPGGGGNI